MRILSFGTALLMLLLETAASSEEGVNILMVGNSYTNVDIESHVENMVYLFEGHVNMDRMARRGATLAEFTLPNDPFEEKIKERSWNWVVLQEQSEIPGFWETPWHDQWTDSKTSVEWLNEEIRENGANTLLLQTWGRLHHDENPTSEMINHLYDNFEDHQARIVEGYRKYQTLISTSDRPVLIAPVGLAFKAIHDEMVVQGLDPEDEEGEFAKLYDSDGSHPSSLGSYLAACVIAGTITGQNVRDLLDFTDIDIDSRVQERLRDVAANTLSAFCQKCAPKRTEKVPYVPKEQLSSSSSSSSFHFVFGIALVGKVIGVALLGLAWKQRQRLQKVVPMARRSLMGRGEALLSQRDVPYSALPSQETNGWN